VAIPGDKDMMPTGQGPEAATVGPTIDVRNVSKWFGSVVAVNDVSLQVRPGIIGLLGPNGAGKTTLLHMIAGLAKPSDGEVTLLGEAVRDNPQIYRRVGVMSEHEAVYGFLTGREFVEFTARLHGLTSLAPAVERAIESVGLTDVQDRPLGTYSRGMRQRMRLAVTLVHDPEILLLDEPLNGTDPRQRIEFHDLMRRLAVEGRTILISSHILEEVETLAGSILLMVSGKLAASGDFHAIRAKLDERPYKVRIVASDPRSMAAVLVRLDVVDSVSVDADGSLVVLSRNVYELQRSVPRLAQEQRIRLLRVEPLDESLESVFSYLVER
jgi:ABC-2 type transport system ATP-binding protein